MFNDDLIERMSQLEISDNKIQQNDLLFSNIFNSNKSNLNVFKLKFIFAKISKFTKRKFFFGF